MVSRMGVQGNALDKPADLRQVVTSQLCQEFQNAHASHPWRARLQSSHWRGLSTFHLPAALWGAFEDALLSGRRPLGTKASEQPLVVQDILRVAGEVFAVK